MPRWGRGRHSGTKARRNSSHPPAKRGRKPIFTEEQKRVLERLIREALKEQLRNLAKTL
jgi:hypothetical protein